MTRLRVSARAVDMLGRQQIAGIPTAIHELFKNAHDAYADRVRVDYFRKQKVLLIKDDGIGMTREDFETRWLTLGTESKVGNNRPYVDPNKPRRIMLGEKGIGRLAIATIGPQVLIVSRAERDNNLSDPVISLVHWGLFQQPGISIDQINIPVTELPGGEVPDRLVICKLADLVRKNVAELGDSLDSSLRDSIYDDLGNIESLNPLNTDQLGGMSLKEGRGTHFFILPTDTILEDDLDQYGTDGIAPPLVKTLIGFSNTMIPDAPEPMIDVAFYDHRKDGTIEDPISKDRFFTPEDFKTADHYFTGDFDEYGQFRGNIKIYDREPIEHFVPGPQNTGQKTACGPFKINIAYVQGNAWESRLPPEIFSIISDKLNKQGGVYIYKNTIRVLPYGNSDYDFLSIERRRTKSAQDYFFSYRRLFGVIEITTDDNPKLEEKAGREGFQENKAYREFKAILENFFYQLAFDFFRKNAPDEYFWQLKNEFENQKKLLDKRRQQAKAKKSNFSKELDVFFERYQRGEYKQIIINLKSKVEEAVANLEDDDAPDHVALVLLDLESQAIEQLNSLRATYKITKPRGFSPGKRLQQDWENYLIATSKLEEESFGPTEDWIKRRLTDAIAEAKADIDNRRRIKNALDIAKKSSLREAKQSRKRVKDHTKALSSEAMNRAAIHFRNLDNGINGVISKFQSTDISGYTPREVDEFRTSLEKDLESIANRETEYLESLREQLQTVLESIRDDISISETLVAVETQSDELRIQLDQYFEMAQIGTALGIIQHEFNSTVIALREGIQRIGTWARKNPPLRDTYNTLRGSFEHLDGYLNLFVPLSRRLQRSKNEITGKQIHYYIRNVFEERLKRHSVDLVVENEFSTKTIYGFSSTFYPCFINLVDNALYWLTKGPGAESIKGNKTIILGADDRGFLLENNGPGIDVRDATRIFDFGFTRKPGGRGMGLYISRETLRREGFDLILENFGIDNHPIFRIWTASETEERDGGE